MDRLAEAHCFLEYQADLNAAALVAALARAYGGGD